MSRPLWKELSVNFQANPQERDVCGSVPQQPHRQIIDRLVTAHRQRLTDATLLVRILTGRKINDRNCWPTGTSARDQVGAVVRSALR